jgi:hypothetical protein
LWEISLFGRGTPHGERFGIPRPFTLLPAKPTLNKKQIPSTIARNARL